MNWELWVVVAWLILTMLLQIGLGERSQQQRTTPATRVLQVSITLALVALIFMGAGGV